MKRALVLLAATAMIYSGPAFAQTLASLMIGTINSDLDLPRYLIFNNKAGRSIVTINLETGALTFGEGISADEAAKETWRILARNYGVGLGDIRVETCAKFLLGPP